MKTGYNVDCEDDCELLKVTLMDNGDWEYDRMGLGVCEGRVFMVDLDDSGELIREMEYVKDGLSVQDVLKIGCDVGVIVQIDWGYDERDLYRVNWDCLPEDWDKFRLLVK
jgi:hypothetical protein